MNRPAREIKFLPAVDGAGEDLHVTWADDGSTEIFPNIKWQYNQVQYMDGSWGRQVTFMDKNCVGLIESMHYSAMARSQAQIANVISTRGRISFADMADGTIMRFSVLMTDQTMAAIETAPDANKLATLDDIAPIQRKPTAKPTTPTDDGDGDGPVFA